MRKELFQFENNCIFQMIEYYRIPAKKKGVESNEIMKISEQYELKDAIHNKSITLMKVLILKNSNINDETLSLLWTITQTLKIIHLDISENFSFITDAGVDHLCQASALRNIKILNLADNSLTDESLRLISKNSNFLKLQELVLYGNSDISSEGLIFLAQSEILKNITKLDLHDTSICDKGMKILIKSDNSAHFTHLNLSMNNCKKITDETLKSISMSKYCDSLIELKLEDCEITDDGVAVLCDSPNCKKIENLILNNSMGKKNNLISDEACKHLTYAKQMNKIKVLELRNTDVTSEGINSLSISLASQNIELLRLSHCKGIRENAIFYLQSIIKYRNMTKLYLNSTSISPQICKKLGEKYPAVHIIY